MTDELYRIISCVRKLTYSENSRMETSMRMKAYLYVCKLIYFTEKCCSFKNYFFLSSTIIAKAIVENLNDLDHKIK